MKQIDMPGSVLLENSTRSGTTQRQRVPRGQPNHNKRFKVRPLIDLIVANFQNEYLP